MSEHAANDLHKRWVRAQKRETERRNAELLEEIRKSVESFGIIHHELIAGPTPVMAEFDTAREASRDR